MSCSLFRVICFIILWAVVLGFGIPALPSSPAVEEYMYDCFTVMACKHKNDTFNKLSECLEPFKSDKLFEASKQQLNMNGEDLSMYATPYEVHEALYCAADTDTKKKLFDFMAQELINLYSGGCRQAEAAEYCDKWDAIMDCGLEMSERMYANGECKV